MLNVIDGVQEARRLLKTGNLQGAFEMYNHLVDTNPRQAQLYFDRASIAVLGQALPQAEQDYRACLALEPDYLPARERLGEMFGRSRASVGATSLPTHANDRQAQFIYAIGSSYIRAFSSTTLFVPLWLGPANELSFITAERAKRTQAHLFATIDRCDLRNPVLLVMGNNDPIMHADNLAGTRDLVVNGAAGSHEQVIEEAAVRYVATIEAILARYHNIQLYILGGCAMFSAEHSRYVRSSNAVLQTHCDRLGIVFIDLNDQLVDPATGTLRVEFASHPDDTHLSKETSVGLVSRRLQERGLLPADIMPFEWSFLWQAPICDGFQVRIWGEPHTGPSNLVHSRTVAFNHVVQRALHVLLGTLALHEGTSPPTVFVPFCREGFVPLALPIGSVGRAVGVCADPAAVTMARRLAGYFGRADVEFYVSPEPFHRRPIEDAYDYVFVALRDDNDWSGEEILAHLSARCRHTLIFLSTVDWSGLKPDPRNSRQIVSIADATTQPPWNEGTILLQRRRAG